MLKKKKSKDKYATETMQSPKSLLLFTTWSLQEKFADHGLGQTHNGKGSLTKIRQHHFIKSSSNILDISNTEEYFFLLVYDWLSLFTFVDSPYLGTSCITGTWNQNCNQMVYLFKKFYIIETSRFQFTKNQYEWLNRYLWAQIQPVTLC